MKASEIAGYAAACLKIYLEALDRDMTLPLRGVEASLCEDGKSVMITVPANGDWITAGFKLFEKTDEASFDPRPWIEPFEAAAWRCAS